MAGRRRSPLEDPPSASSSHEDEDEDEEDGVESGGEEVKEEHKQKQQQENSSDDGEEETEEESEEDEPEPAPAPAPAPIISSQKKPIPKAPQPQPSDSEESDGSDTDDDSESLRSLKSPGASDFIVKPNTSKSIDSDVKSHQKASGKPAMVPPSSSKRSVKFSKEPNKKENTLMVADGDDSNKAVAPEKRPARIWSEADEIALLKAIIEFELKKGTDPLSDTPKFYEFIKRSKTLHFDVSEKQMVCKIKRLKKKCNDNIAKFSNGEDPVFAKAHDYKIFDWSKKIWKGDNAKAKISKKSAAPSSGNVIPAESKSGAKSFKEKKNVAKSSNDMVDASSKYGVKSSNTAMKENLESNGTLSNEEEHVKMEDAKVKHCKRGVSEMYPFLYETIQSMDEIPFVKGADLSLIDKSKLEDLEHKCKKQKIAEVEVSLKKMEWMLEVGKLLITAVKSAY